MRLVVGNVATKAVVGGVDHLLDFDVMEELRSYLRVRPEGYHRSPRYKKRIWDGWKYFISKQGLFATGYLEMVATYMESLGVEVHIEDERDNLPILNKVLDPYIGKIDGEDWYGFDYQLKMVNKLSNHIHVGGQDVYFPRGIFDAATNAGKNSIAALIIKNLVTQRNCLFMVSGMEIYEQAVEFLTQVIGEPVGEISSKKYNPTWCTVAMVKSLYNKAQKSINVRKYLSDIQVLIVDESDEAGAAEYSKCLSYVGAGMRVFVSGTPLDSNQVSNMMSIGLSGKVLGRITNKFLIENGYSQMPLVNILYCKSKMPALRSYPIEEEHGIHTSMERIHLMATIIEKHRGEPILVSFDNIAHGEFMLDQLQDIFPELDMGIAHGDPKKKNERKQNIKDFKEGKLDVLFASMILKRGANIPVIRVMIMAHGGKSVITVKQLAGRGMRHDHENDHFYLYDFYDFGKYLAKHSRKRISIYKKEGFDVTEHYETKRGVAVIS